MARRNAADAKTVVVAPFANERIREWPIWRYREAVDLLCPTHRVVVVGTRSQRVRANGLVRGHDPKRVVNACGAISWDEVLAEIAACDFVLANNSGIAHVAAELGVWTLCVFAGSHPYHQWRPIGPRVVVVAAGIACAPCEIGTDLCPNGAACTERLDAGKVLLLFEREKARAAAPVPPRGHER